MIDIWFLKNPLNTLGAIGSHTGTTEFYYKEEKLWLWHDTAPPPLVQMEFGQRIMTFNFLIDFMNFLKKLKKKVFVCGKWYFGHRGQTVTSRSMKTTVRSKLGEDRSIDTMQVKIGRVVSEEIVDKHTNKQNSLYY